MNKFGLYKYRKLTLRVGLLFFSIFLVSVEPYNVIDGVTAASVIATPTPPVLQITASPNIVNGVVQAQVGQPLTINISGTDPNGYKTLYVGIVESGYLYNVQSSFPTPLPSGAVFQLVGNDPTKATITWTPTASSANTSTNIEFAALNTYWGTYSLQNISINTVNAVENNPPSFDAASISTQQSVLVGTQYNIPIIVNPDTDNDNVTMTASNLPNGAVLGGAAINAKGQWVAVLTWTPTSQEIGSQAITFTAQDNQETTVSSYTVNFTVVNPSHPEFAASMPSLQKAVQNTPLIYNVIVKPDSQTNNVLITATGLPQGASLSKPVLSNGQLIAIMTWTPNASQINNTFPVTFTAEDNTAGAIPVMFKTTFTAVPHYSVINKALVKR